MGSGAPFQMTKFSSVFCEFFDVKSDVRHKRPGRDLCNLCFEIQTELDILERTQSMAEADPELSEYAQEVATQRENLQRLLIQHHEHSMSHRRLWRAICDAGVAGWVVLMEDFSANGRLPHYGKNCPNIGVQQLCFAGLSCLSLL